MREWTKTGRIRPDGTNTWNGKDWMLSATAQTYGDKTVTQSITLFHMEGKDCHHRAKTLEKAFTGINVTVFENKNVMHEICQDQKQETTEIKNYHLYNDSTSVKRKNWRNRSLERPANTYPAQTEALVRCSKSYYLLRKLNICTYEGYHASFILEQSHGVTSRCWFHLHPSVSSPKWERTLSSSCRRFAASSWPHWYCPNEA